MGMENDLKDWLDLHSVSRPTSLSTDTESRSGPTPDSSIAESTGCENIQAPALDEIATSTVTILQNGSATHDGCEEEPKLCCMHHTHPEDERPTYTAIKELKRHQKEHDPEAILWHCGCCQNLGVKFEPKVRKDKVQTHLRSIHEKRKSGRNKGIHCSAEGCYALFTAASCIDQHWRQHHADQLQEVSSQTTADDKCNCKQSAEFGRMHESLQSGSNKRVATSPLESKAKQGRLETVEHQNQCSELVPQAVNFHNSPVPFYPRLSNDVFFPPFNNSSFYPMNESQNIDCSNMDQLLPSDDWAGDIASPYTFYTGAANMNNGASMPSILPEMDPLHIDSWTPSFRLCLEDSKPADFLAIRKTQDFQDLAVSLRRTSNEYPYRPINAITYNPKKEILTLTADSEPKVKKAMTDLRLLIENFSKSRGRKYLVTSHPSTSRALLLDNSNAHGSTNSRTPRTFPIIPKENRRLVQIWFKSILPALPKILSECLGGIYSVSLIRRGQSDFSAEPCIQIGSPCVPEQAAQKVIKDLVGKMWEKDGFQQIAMRFIKGSIKKISGVEGIDDDDGGESADVRRLDFNYKRPYSKPGMGASVGLLCSDKLSATLGGYVLIGGKKYLLTSEHFIANARALADPNDDCDTLTSPSREDLRNMENNLKQNKRDSDSNVNSLVEKGYGDKDYAEEFFSDPNLSNELRDAMSNNEDIKSLLDQVTSLPLEYAVGKVRKLSLGAPRRHSISRTLATQVGLQNDELEVKHSMDWALITTDNRTAQAGENRHKYRSNKDAIEDNLYVDENNRASQSGDVVYETCGAESGHLVYYVGQKSKHRIGKVSLPVFDNSSGTLAWGIIGSDGQEIPYSDVAGDSGAWVIREDNNRLMGQVHSHDHGQVLFTPIDVIFAELEETCGGKVSLPPGPHHIPSTVPAQQLCSVPQTPRARAYEFNKTALVQPITAPGISPIKTIVPEAEQLESSSVMTFIRSTNTTHRQRSSDSQCDSPSSLPTLMDSPLSSVTTPEYPKSPQSSGSSDFVSGQVDIERLSSMSLPNIVGESTVSEIPELSLEEPREDQPVESKPYKIQFNFQSLPGTTLGTRTSTWPVTFKKSQVTKARPGSGFTRLRTFRNHTVPYSARAVLDRFARFARRIEDVTDIETVSRPCEHEFCALPTLEDVRKRDYSFIPEGCNVAA